jgi:hypothetical protein
MRVHLAVLAMTAEMDQSGFGGQAALQLTATALKLALCLLHGVSPRKIVVIMRDEGSGRKQPR